MNKEKIASLSIIVLALVISGALVATTVAAQESQVTFPVAELGNCPDKESCKAYCDKSGNMAACISFAKKNKLMDESELQVAENILKNGGPGGCKNREECETFCNNVDNIDQCVSFAEKHNLMPAGELDEARKIQAALKRGVKMPPCKNKKDCDAYCSDPNNIEMCMNFAIEAGFMPESEREDAKKMLQAVKKGVKPPSCRGKKECEEFCSQDANLDQCVSFAEAAGFMTPEQAARSRKTGGKGPGGCKGAECETFCNKPENQEICFQYSVDNDLIPEADRERMREGGRQGSEMLRQAPPEVINCIKSKIGDEEFEKIKSGKPSRQEGDPFRTCFDENMNRQGERGQRDERGMKPNQGPPPMMGEDDRARYRPEGAPPPESYRRPPEGSPDMMRPPEGSPYPSGYPGMMPPPEGSSYPSPNQSSYPSPSSGPSNSSGESVQYVPPPETQTTAPPPPPPSEPPPPTDSSGTSGESAPQSRLTEYLTATIFNAESPFLQLLQSTRK